MKITLILLIFFSTAINADNYFDSVHIDTNTCNLVNSSVDGEVIYEGIQKMNRCIITVPTSEFNKKYRFCSLSGVMAKDGQPNCHFRHSNKDGAKVSFFNTNTSFCGFTCVKNK